MNKGMSRADYNAIRAMSECCFSKGQRVRMVNNPSITGTVTRVRNDWSGVNIGVKCCDGKYRWFTPEELEWNL